MKLQAINNGSVFLKAILDELKLLIDTEIVSPVPHELDGLARVNKHLVAIAVKAEITPQQVTGIANRLSPYLEKEHAMVIANYITPEAKELLKEKQLNYLDKAGNIYLKLPDLLIQLEGNKTNSLAPEYRSRAFSKSGGAVVFQFLMDPSLVNAPQRLIAQYAGVSLGTIPRVFEGLHKDGFLVKLDQTKWQLVDYEKLINKWVEVLNDKILPAHYLQQYQPGSKPLGQFMDEHQIGGETQWGGEPAAALMTRYLRPEKFTLFTANDQELIQKYKLIPSTQGEIAVYKKFWNHSEAEKEHVHPVLVYAQLMGTRDSRNIETAEILFNEHIRPKL